MPDILTSNDFLTRLPGVPVIDVRTPDEFSIGHIPGALNVPLFSNTERAAIGTAYKQQGRSSAVCLGLRCVGPKLEQLARTLLDLTCEEDPRLHIYCWRGGMRSASVAWLIETTFGCRVATLKGGYKAFRHWVLDSFMLPRELRVVAGLTGCGKTEILRQLAALGESTVDLEALAHHKGSAFGQLGELAQPTQAQFENNLALAWRATDPTRPLWIEDESRMIGKRILPEAIWQLKANARFHVIEIPEAERITHLCNVYAAFPPADLSTRVQAIHSRLGGGRAQAAIDAINNGAFADACRIILSYYDRTYQKCLAVYPPANISHHPFARLQPLDIAVGLIEHIRTLP